MNRLVDRFQSWIVTEWFASDVLRCSGLSAFTTSAFSLCHVIGCLQIAQAFDQLLYLLDVLEPQMSSAGFSTESLVEAVGVLVIAALHPVHVHAQLLELREFVAPG